MMFRKHRTVWLSVLVVAVISGSIGAGAVMAKSLLNPIGEDGVISGAYQKDNGILRLVNSEEDVRPSEVFIQWNQQGDKAAEQEIKDGICVMCEALDLVEEAPGFCFAIKQHQTVHHMLYICTANTLYRETGEEVLEYAPSLEALAEWCECDLRIEDGWGNPFVYYREHPEFTYTLISLGYDGVEGPAPPDPWFFGESGESDIIWDTGWWVQVPVEP